MNKVLIVDDHPVIRLAVRMLMERHGYEVVAETDNGVDALQLAREHMPDIVILDIGIPKLDGLEVICRLSSTKQAQPFKVLVLTSQAPGHFSMRCMHAGAAGYVCKQQDLTELLSAIKAVLSGYSYFPNQALNSVRSSQGNTCEADMVERLSGREMMVLQQLAQGKTNKEIADGMFLSNKTVSTYKTRLLLKLNARSLVDLIELAQRNGLV
ncbi:response regulator transcription factor [Pseudomonas sp. WS 5059]|jgi:two-component system response regulator EvgA|uniref:response regulator transcription factor n=1 Tax=unclassified Pseudomonas TaxID=196821 RepID=UPI001472D9BF|nr:MULTISPECIES: response regulator transcription factor [unclassified Pseudomonas]NMX61153.1 response regulator transcription factor [Pseudomonas sp. WS 5079]NMX68494.1 response regulator transcription factor [Pseudomonas sp. WS 5111]NMX86224.1 response regulator transcription factor [Pseudomonas sp. WS 5010]NMY02793.1 response regulator transcription factor [Pseudomonas sp. WS 5059]NMY24760.1 response regulator transcription factor [Pseudomonas sp. WS 5021]